MAEHASITSKSSSIVHILTDEDWASRTAENKLCMVAREASRRLHGMHDILYGLALNHQLGGGQNYEHLAFLGSTVMDLSKALARAHQEYGSAVEAADQVPPSKASSKSAAGATKKRRA